MAVIYCPVGYEIIPSREGGTDGQMSVDLASLTAFQYMFMRACTREADSQAVRHAAAYCRSTTPKPHHAVIR